MAELGARPPRVPFLGPFVRNAAGNVAGPLAGLASAPVLATALGVDGRGAVTAVTAPLLLATSVSAVGLPDAVTYFVARWPAAHSVVRRRGAVGVAVTAAVTALVTVALAPVLAAGSSELAAQITLAALAVVPTALVGVLRGHAAGLGRWDAVAAERTAAPVLRLAAFIVLAALGELQVGSAAVTIAVTPVLGGLVYLRPRPEEGADAHPTPDADPRFRRLLGYGSRAWMGTLAGVVLSRLDQVLMTPLASLDQLGLYAVAVTVSELPLVFTTAVREVVLTAHARRPDDGDLARAGRLASAASAVVAVVIGGSAVWWMPAVFGPGFRAAVAPTVVLLVAVTIGVPGSVAGAGLSARGLPHLRSVAMLLGAATNIVALVVLVPTLGALGAALATVIGNGIAGTLNVVQVARRTHLPFWSFSLLTFQDCRSVLAAAHRASRTVARRARKRRGAQP